jgi:hypothetical protein
VAQAAKKKYQVTAPSAMKRGACCISSSRADGI